jgi:glycosyltransferase involved in cell wall biosynthesis
MSRDLQILVEVEETISAADKILTSKPRPFVVAGIPAYDEEKTIARVVLGAQKFSDMVIVCDDGSSDLTGEIAKRLGAEVIRHEDNLGYGAAIKSLFKRARELSADVLVTLDADGQHDPMEIPAILKPIDDGIADIVIGSRFIDATGTAEMPLYRRFGAKLITNIVKGSTKNGVSDAQSGFRAYGPQAIERLDVIEAGMGASVEILLEASKHNLRIFEVPSICKYNNGKVATSTENPVTHGVNLIMSIIRFVVEEKPLFILGIPGMMFLLVGISFGVWMMQIYALRKVIETNVALASLALVVIGFFMLSTAITLYAISRISKKIS